MRARFSRLTADRATIRTFVDAYKMAAWLPNKACRWKCVSFSEEREESGVICGLFGRRLEEGNREIFL